ncbi:MAG: NAD(P)/FAD-dependent oxidoreductase, partial [Deltaproteobacteria bacterium]
MSYVGEYDVVVVGAGPVGATVAREAAKGGARVLLLERRKSPIYPERCAGIISPRCLREANVDGGVVVRRIRGGYIHAPDG